MTSYNDATASQPLSAAPLRRAWTSRFARWEWMLVVLIITVALANSLLSPFFLNVQNLARASSDFIEMGLMMLPMVFIIITGNVDLSVASMLGMTASFLGWLHMNGVNIWVAAVTALALGLTAGLLNGFLISRLKVPALVITLGAYAFYRGIAYVLLGDQAARDYPPAFTWIGQGTIPGTPVPFSVLIFSVLALIFGLVLHKTVLGRYLYAIGNNQEAALFSGVPVARVKMIIFALAGLMSAVAGIVMASRFASTRPDIGLGLELAVITATVLGGVDINGGKGTMIGAILALLLIGLMRFGMGLLNIQGQVQSIAIGALLVLSILLPNLAHIRRANLAAQDRRWIVAIGLAAIGIVALFALFLSVRETVLSFY